MAPFESLLYQQGDRYVRITLNRPPLNILNIQMMRELSQALATARDDPRVHAVAIGAQGKAFCAGVDIKDHIAERVPEMIDAFHGIFHTLREMPQPTLALVNGMALGGGFELALFCDLVIAAQEATFGQPEIKVGVFPPLAAVMLPRLIGRKKALEAVLLGETMSAQEAARLGLVNKAVPQDRLEEEANLWLSKLSALSGTVLRLAKKATYAGIDTDFGPVLGQVEAIYLKELMSTHDAQEGLNAFLGKRSPLWEDK
ncbi:MAG: enoyl-CoA hydratase/isomerase family protein [Chloroflexi bacterium]|nr:enoyl-CoA hydratase/isomerase family protein [Chloroflexota bacterium]